jgi:hypothetical protein
VNLLTLTAGAISTVNPPICCTLQQSTGYTIGPDGSQQPSYRTFTGVPCQIQSLTSQDLRHLDALNLQGTMRAIYLFGNIEGVDRSAVKGGDMFIFPDLPTFRGPTTWLVTQVIEHWDGTTGWTKIAVTLQGKQ